MPKMIQNVAKNGAKLGILVAKLANIALSWRHLGRSWCQDGSQEASKWSSRGSPDRILGHLGAQNVPEQLQAPPPSPPPTGSSFH